MIWARGGGSPLPSETRDGDLLIEDDEPALSASSWSRSREAELVNLLSFADTECWTGERISCAVCPRIYYSSVN